MPLLGLLSDIVLLVIEIGIDPNCNPALRSDVGSLVGTIVGSIVGFIGLICCCYKLCKKKK